MKKPRFYTSLGVVTVAVLLFCFLPLPHSVICPLEIQARDAQPVYVDVEGKLTAIDVKAGDRVTAGQPLAQLENIDLNLEIAKLEGELKLNEAQQKSLMQQSFRDPHAAAQLSQIQEILNTFREQLAQKRSDERRLRLVAPVAGTVLPPTLTPSHDRGEETLPSWSGTPLEPENLGAYLEKRVLFCQIGDPKKLEAVLVIDQSDRSLIQDGQQVKIKLEGFPNQTIHGEIAEVAESELKTTPRRLATQHGGEVPTKMDPQTGQETPINTSYQARVPFDNPKGIYLLGLRGQARVSTRPISLGARLWRLITHTFNFKM